MWLDRNRIVSARCVGLDCFREGINSAPADPCLRRRRLLLVGVRSQRLGKRRSAWPR
jgi:hypothetical protein